MRRVVVTLCMVAAVVAHLTPPAAAADPPAGLPLASTVAALDGYLSAAANSLRTANPGNIPFVGKGPIDHGTEFLTAVRTQLDGLLRSLPDARKVSPASVKTTLAAAGRPFGLAITPDFRCGNNPCGDDAAPATVTRVLLTLDAGQEGGACGAPCVTNIPFTVGLPGLQFKSDETVTSTFSWHLRVAVGVDTGGAFLVTTNAPELQVGLDVLLPKTMDGTLGFINVKTDIDGAIDGRGRFRGTFTFDATAPGGEVRAAQAETVGMNVALTAGADATIKAEAAPDAAMPGIGADLHVHSDWNSGQPGSTAGLAVTLEHVHVTPGALLGKAIQPIINGLRDAVAPIAPVAEVLNAPIPGISDVFGDTTALDVARTGANASKMAQIQGIEQIIDIATKLTVTLDASNKNNIDLGRVVFDNAQLLSTSGAPVTPSTSLLASVVDGCTVCGQAVQTIKALVAGGPKLTFPVLDDPKSLVGVLVGNNVPLVQFESGPLDVDGDFSGLSGGSFAGYGLSLKQPSLSIKANVRLGYDTAGFRNALAHGRPATIADGLWVDGGSFVEFNSSLELQFSVNLGIVSAGLRGGPELHGFARVRNGVAGQLVRPATGRLACAFVLGGRVSANVKIVLDLLFGDVVIPIIDYTLADFSALDAANCADVNVLPVLAQRDGSDLLINVGDHREDRNPPGKNGFEGHDTDAESTRVTAERRGPDGKQVIRVDLMGYSQTFLSTPEAPIIGIKIDALHHRGAETLVTATDNGRPFDLSVFVVGAQGGNTVTARTDAAHQVGFFGSPATDRVTTGDANDFVAAGGGDDNLRLGKGNDTAIGGPGNDVLDGGPGIDDLRGQEGDDVLIAGNDSPRDILVGGSGNDFLSGSAGADQLFGDECSPTMDSLFTCDAGYGLSPDAPGLPGGGNDTLLGAGGPDVMVGGTGTDEMSSGSVPASGGVNAQRVTAYGGGGNDVFVGGPGPDTFYGGPDNDGALGGGDSDLLVGGTGNDVLGGGNTTGVPIPGHPLNPAPLGSTAQADQLRGGPGNDNLLGSTGADVVEGGPDSDVVDGAEGDDLVIGGSQAAGTPDVSDLAKGGPGNDVVIGDNGDRVVGIPRQYDIAGAVIGGADQLSGDAGDDVVLGGVGNDTVRGDDGNDRLEGGAGSDYVDGGDGQDDILGGNSPSFLGSVTAAAGDAGDSALIGGGGHDVILGDNGTIVRGPVVADDPDAPDRISRTVRFLDSGPAGVIVGGNDHIFGGEGHDVAFGQVGDDEVVGGNGNDDLEGNQGADTIQGGSGQDDIVGGTSPTALGSGATTSQYPDSGDTFLAGDDGDDAIVGDNAAITRGPVVADDPEARNRVSRIVRLLDSGSTGVVVGGNDRISGGPGHDLLWGQVGDDVIAGDAGNDSIEGNQGADVLDGGEGQDDVVGGTTPAALPPGLTTAQFPDAGDTVAGGDSSDLLVGDNAVIGHSVGADGRWARSPADGRYLRTVTLADRATIGGPDTIIGGGGNDDAFGGLGDDHLNGCTGQDYLEGNQGADTIDGSSGDDDIVGGTSPIGVGGDEQAAGATPDGADVIHGRAANEPAQIPPSGLAIGVDTKLNDNGLSVSVSIRYGPIPEPAPGTEPDGDVVAGDNARIDRCRPEGFLFPQWKGRDGCTWSTSSVLFYGPTTSRWVQQLGQPLFGLGVLDELFPDSHSGNDVIFGDDGDDLLLGQGGFDTIHGGAGDDIVYGGLGVFNKLYGDGGGIDVVITPPDLSLLAVLGVV